MGQCPRPIRAVSYARSVKSSRIPALVASSTALLLLLSGCFGLPRVVIPDTKSVPTGEDVPENLKPYYEQVLTWEDCDNGMQCTTAIAPMDWANPSPETDIELAMVRQPATGSQRLGSLFTNPGGPGASGFDFVYDSVTLPRARTCRPRTTSSVGILAVWVAPLR